MLSPSRARARRAGAIATALAVCAAAPLTWVATGTAEGAPPLPATALTQALPEQAPTEPTMTMNGEMRPGGSMTVDSQGWQPGATVSLAMNGTIVGTGIADAVGAVTISAAIPMSMAPGAYTMTMTGLALGGTVATLTEGVTLGDAVGAAVGGATPAQPVTAAPQTAG